jgi:Tol biopolymer transport system component
MSLQYKSNMETPIVHSSLSFAKKILPGLAIAAACASALTAQAAPAPAAGSKGELLMYRIAPTTSELYVANADGSGEHRLIPSDGYDYHGSFSPDGKWIVFTSEREGLGQASLYRVRVDGTGLQKLTDWIGISDAASYDPADPDVIAFVSSRRGKDSWGTTNIWTLNVKTGALRNVTGDIKFDPAKPHSFFRPSWSPDGKWIALSSDIGTDWRGHNLPVGWERTQESSIYAIHPDGTGFKQIATHPGYAEGSPSWSADGKRVVFYETQVEATWGVHRPELINKVSSQIVQVDVATGERKELTSTPGFKVFPQYVGADKVAYHVKGGQHEGIYMTDGYSRATAGSGIRSPRYSADGKQVVYEKVVYDKPLQPNGTKLYSFEPGWDARFVDAFPQLSRNRKKLVWTEKSQDSSIAISNTDFTGYRRIYDASSSGIDPKLLAQGLAGAFAPTWSPDGKWVAFGVGSWFFTRAYMPARIARVRTDASMKDKPEILTDGKENAGFPSYSPDGRKIVYRVWSPKDKGLRVIDLKTRKVTVLTTDPDNLPNWSPNGKKIVFTRKEVSPRDPNKFHFDIYTINPDGTGIERLTTPGANKAHATWTWDGRITYSSGDYGFRDELSLYDNTFQPDGQDWIMNADGSGQHAMTDTLWEEWMPVFIPKKQ